MSDFLRTVKLFSKVTISFWAPLLLTLNENSSYSKSSPILGIVSLFNFSRFSGCIKISHWDFNLHFPMTNTVDVILCLLAICIYIYLSEINVYVFCSFSLHILVFIPLSFRFLGIFYSSPLSNLWFETIVSQPLCNLVFLLS